MKGRLSQLFPFYLRLSEEKGDEDNGEDGGGEGGADALCEG